MNAARSPGMDMAAPAGVARGRNVQFALVTLAAMIALYGRMAVSPLQEHMAAALALTDTQMALLQGPALSLPMVLLAIPLGLAIDRYARPRLFILFSAATLIGTLLTAWAPSFALLLVARCIVGFAATATAITAFAVIADLFAPAQRGRASMVVVIGQVVGLSASFAVGGLLLGALDADGDGWRWALTLMSAPLLVAALLCWAMREPPRNLQAEAPATPGRSIGELLRTRSVMIVLAGLIMAEIAAVVIPVWSAPALMRRFDLSAATVGATMSVALLASGIAGPILGGFLADLCQRTGGARRTMLALGALALISAPLGLYALAADIWTAGLVMTGFKTLVGAMLVICVALLTIAAPAHLRGLTLGIMAGTNNLFAGALAPLMVSGLSVALGGPSMIPQALAAVCVATGLLGALIFLAGSRIFPPVRHGQGA